MARLGTRRARGTRGASCVPGSRGDLPGGARLDLGAGTTPAPRPGRRVARTRNRLRDRVNSARCREPCDVQTRWRRETRRARLLAGRSEGRQESVRRRTPRRRVAAPTSAARAFAPAATTDPHPDTSRRTGRAPTRAGSTGAKARRRPRPPAQRRRSSNLRIRLELARPRRTRFRRTRPRWRGAPRRRPGRQSDSQAGTAHRSRRVRRAPRRRRAASVRPAATPGAPLPRPSPPRARHRPRCRRRRSSRPGPVALTPGVPRRLRQQH